MDKEKIKFNKKLINRIVIVRDGNKTWKGKILDVLSAETFSVKDQNSPDSKDKEVDIYNIEKIL